jgi:hypothetical protein
MMPSSQKQVSGAQALGARLGRSRSNGLRYIYIEVGSLVDLPDTCRKKRGVPLAKWGKVLN